MSESVKQSLSAMMDDEADQFEVRRLLQQVDEESTEVWARYQLASAVLKGDSVSAEGLGLSDAVSQALEAEPAYRKAAGWGLWKPLGSVAVAASVTAMVMFGAQNFSGDTVSEEMAVQAVLPAPAPSRSELLPAQYGRAPLGGAQVGLTNSEVIRLSSSMEYYIHQHHDLMRERVESWHADWVPAGFHQVRHDVMPDAELMLFSNGRAAISVSVEPYDKRKALAGTIQDGDTVAFGKRIGDQFVTVVGDLPLMMADRIASSVQLSER